MTLPEEGIQVETKVVTEEEDENGEVVVKVVTKIQIDGDTSTDDESDSESEPPKTPHTPSPFYRSEAEVEKDGETLQEAFEGEVDKVLETEKDGVTEVSTATTESDTLTIQST